MIKNAYFQYSDRSLCASNSNVDAMHQLKLISENKYCSNKKCLKENPQSLSNFNKNSTKIDGLSNQCRSCLKIANANYAAGSKEQKAAYSKRWRLENPERARLKSRESKSRNKDKVRILNRKNRLNRLYGITIDQFNEMFALQLGRCAICNIHSSELSKGLHIDHCHKTEKVRKLLCYRCNSILGYSKEDLKILNASIAYIKGHL